jgi:hypothetical protein
LSTVAPGDASSPDAGTGEPATATPTADTSPAPRRRRSPATLLTWLTVVVVLVVVVVLLAVKAGTGNLGMSPPQPPQITPASPGLVSQVTAIPASVYDQIGVTSPAAVITPPVAVSHQAALTKGGKPVVFFYGAEYCGYCAGERWALVAALSRFGTFNGLGLMRSTGTQSPAGIETFTFRNATFRSKYVALETVERRTAYNPTGAGFTSLQVPSPAQSRLLVAFHVAGYPFVDFANRYVTSGPSYSPTFLSGLTWDQIGSFLSQPGQARQPVAEGIVSLANFYTAAVCASTGQRPAAVCDSRGVEVAAGAMGVSGKG